MANSGGTNIESLVIAVDVTDAAKAAPILNQLGAAADAAAAKADNLNASQKESSKSFEETSKSAGKAGKAHDEMGISLGNARAKTEMLVLAHEALQGRYTRMAGSLMVFAEYTNAASLVTSKLGVAVLGAAGALAALSYVVAKGIQEQKEMANALIMTGNYAGVTSTALDQLAHSAAGSSASISEAKKTVIALAASGRFTGEQIGQVTASIVDLEHSTGQSIEKTIKQFESLSVQAGTHSSKAADHISNNVIKLNEQYHFLTEAVYEQIRALEREGKQMEASALATQTFADETERRAKEAAANIGLIEGAWNKVTHAIGNAKSAIGDWGKNATPESKVSDALAKKARAESNLGEANKFLNVWSSNPFALLSEFSEKGKLVQINKELDAANKSLLRTMENATAQSQKAIAEEKAIAAAKNLTIGDIRDQKKSMDELNIALAANKQMEKNIRDANPNSDLITEDAIAKRMAATIKAHEKVAAVVNDGRKQDLLDQLANDKAKYELIKIALEGEDKLAKAAHQAGQISDREYYAIVRDAKQKDLAARKDELDSELAILNAYKARNKVDEEETKKRLNGVVNAYKEAKLKIENEAKLNDQLDMFAAKKVVSDSDDRSNAYLSTLDKEVQKLNEGNVAREKSKASIEFEAIAHIQSAVAALEENKALQELEITKLRLATASGDEIRIAQEGIKVRESELDATNKSIQFLQNVLQLRTQIANAEVKKDDEKAYDKYFKDIETGAKKIETSLSSAFGNVGKSIGKAIVSLTEYQKKQNDVTKEFSKNFANAGANEEKQIAATDKYRTDSVKLQLQSYGDVAEAAQGFFKQNSTGYQILGDVSKAFHLAEIAMTVEEMLAKVNASTTVAATKAIEIGVFEAGSAAETIYTAMSVANAEVQSSAWGVTAVIKAIASMPFPANLIAGAVTLAAVVALGAKIAGGVGGGSADSTAKDRQAAAGTGSILGDDLAKSESMKKSIDILQKNSSITLPITQSMLAALHSIRDNIQGMAALVVQSTGLTGTYADKIAAGESSSSGFLGIGSTTRSLVDQGILLDSNQTIGSVTNQGINASSYSAIRETDSGLWGLGSSDSTRTQTANLKADIKDAFSQSIAQMRDGVLKAAESLGLGGDAVISKIDSMTLGLSNISLLGMKGTDIPAYLESILSKFGDDMAKLALPKLAGFKRVGEGMLETATRVVTGIETTKQALEKLGLTMISYTDILNKQGDVGAELARQSIMKIEGTGAFYNVHTDAKSYSYQETSQVAKPTQYIANPDMSPEAGNGPDPLIALPTSYETITKTITSVTAASDKLVEKLTGVGEIMSTMSGTGEEIIAMYSSLMAVRDQMRAVGMAAQDLGLSLIKGAGGITELADGLSSYQDKYFTDAEKSKAELTALSDKFAKLGEIMPTTKEGLRALIENTGTSTDASAKLTGQLLSLSGAFSDAQDHVKSLADAAKTKALTAADDAFSILQQAVDNQKKTLQAAYDEQSKFLQDQAQTASTSLDTIKSVFKTLEGALTTLAPLSRSAAQAVLNNAVASSDAGGSLKDFPQLNEALQAVAQPSEQLFNSFQDWQRDQRLTANTVSKLKDNAGAQVSVAQMTLDAINKSIEALDKNHNDDIAKLDQTINNAQAQINALKGIDDSVVSVQLAIQNLANAIMGVKNASAPSAPSKASPEAQASKLTADINKYAANNPGNSYYFIPGVNDFNAKFESAQNLSKQLGSYDPSKFGTPELALLNSTGHDIAYWKDMQAQFDAGLKPKASFAVGIDKVPYNMSANIHEGEKIFPAADNRELMARLAKPSETSDLIAEVKALREENKSSKEMFEAHLYAIAKSAKLTSDSLDDVILGGRSIRTTVV